MLKREDIRIRDPFIYTDTANGCYYMYGTTDLIQGSYNTKNIFSVYRSCDLECFDEPKVIFDGSKNNFWADKCFWASELHKYKDKFYLFGSCIADGKCRGTHIFVCDTPDGEFAPLSDEPVTPRAWECLDGTFWVEDGVPYMVFCHEWVQVGDGEICAVQLSDDLTHPVGEPFLLFCASENPYVDERGKNGGIYITDGPFIYSENGKLNMIWSSFHKGNYTVLLAQSESIRGKWAHTKTELDFDCGHAMIFKRLDGERMISMHYPNKTDKERALFRKY